MMNAWLVVFLSLAITALSLAEKFEPVECDWNKDTMCSGEWNEDWTEQLTADYCIPSKIGDCWNSCPKQCSKDEMNCPGKMHSDGCQDADFCHWGKFCPVECDWGNEMHCPGTLDPKIGEQITADFCLPQKSGDCENHCPVSCGEHEILCLGPINPHTGCMSPDMCEPGKFCPAQCNWEEESHCSGEWNEDWTVQLTADYCIPSKIGDCWNDCPKQCGKDEISCPGHKEYDGCLSPDFCASGKFCPADCNWDTEMSCPGFWDPKTGEQFTSDTCVVAKIGDCENHCPMDCGENEILCPGKIDPHTGCKMPDSCQPGKFCSPDCNYDEIWCPGEWTEDWKEQTSADFCMPMKYGDCEVFCPKQCNKDEMNCPGRIRDDGCQDPDYCSYGKFCPAECSWDEMSCPGTWDPKTGGQTTADFCMPAKNGDCESHCPVTCGKNEILCPGQIDKYTGCKGPDSCQSGKFCHVECDHDNELWCNGEWTVDWSEQITADYCIPNKIGDCWNSCPKQCEKEEVVCPGTKDSNGCHIMADTCCPL